MTALRPIAAIELPGVEPQKPPTAMPELTLINPRDVLVDEKYQRNISLRSIDLIARIVAGFDWRRWRPPVCAWTEAGLTAIDGQHSLIAAACNPHVSEVPVLVVNAETIEERASTFIAVNRDRLAVSKRQLHAAAVTAGDPTAVATQALCDRLGIKVLKTQPNAKAKYAARETCAITQIGNMVERIGIELAGIVLQVLVDAECAPIRETQIRAAELLLIDDEFSGQISPAELTATIVTLGAAGEKEARVFSATHGVPQWRGLAATWFQKRKRGRATPKLAAFNPVDGKFSPPPAAAPAPPAPTFTSVLPTPTGPERRHVVPMVGEPEPGRSALDQRRAAR